MSPRRPGPDPSSRSAPNANETFKSRWKTRQQWSMVAAVALHVAFFAFFPALEQPDRAPDFAPESSSFEVVAVDEEAPGPGNGLPVSVLVREAPQPEPEPETPAPDNGGDEAEADRTTAPDAVLEDLRRRTAALPAVVEPEPEPEPDEPIRDRDSTSTPGDGPEIRDGEVSIPDSAISSEGEGPALDRLSSLRPEMAFGSPESWILIRNPAQVGAFLRNRFGKAAVGSSDPGMLSVAIWVDDRGSVEWAEIHRSSGRRTLDESAIELFTEVASFRPARQRGASVPLAAIFWLPYPW